MQKVVYLIFAYNLQEQIIRLAKAIVHGSQTAHVFIHYDAKIGYFDQALLQGTPRVDIIPNPISVEWGDWSQVKAVLNSLNYIYKQVEFDWFVVLSGQDFPTKPISSFESFLDHSDYDAYLEARPQDNVPRENHTIARYYYRHWKIPNFKYTHKFPAILRASWKRFLESLPEGEGLLTYIWAPHGRPNRLGIRSMRVPFGPDFVCWQGSDWFIFSRRAVDYLLEFIDRRPDVVCHYMHTFIPSESFYQSILYNAKDLRMHNDNLRFAIWNDESDSGPKTLTHSDLPAVVDSHAFFARKFDVDIDSEVLDELESRISPRI